MLIENKNALMTITGNCTKFLDTYSISLSTDHSSSTTLSLAHLFTRVSRISVYICSLLSTKHTRLCCKSDSHSKRRVSARRNVSKHTSTSTTQATIKTHCRSPLHSKQPKPNLGSCTSQAATVVTLTTVWGKLRGHCFEHRFQSKGTG